MSSPPVRVLTIGDLTADLIVPVPRFPIQASEFLVSEKLQLEPGGCANLLILLARLGAEAVALGTLGMDHWAEGVFQILQAEGVDLSLMDREGSTNVALVLVDTAGHHSFVGTYGRGRLRSLGETEREMIVAADALFASGHSLSENRCRDLTLAALELAGQRAIPRFFDPGPAFAALQPQLQRRALARIDVLLLTEEELRDLSAAGVDVLPRADHGRQPGFCPGLAQSQEASARSTLQTVVVKLGAAGCRIFTRSSPGEPSEVTGFDFSGLQIPVRDTTAAGDCFDAAYLFGYLKGWSPQDCARLGNCAGAVAVQKLGGGRNVPTVEELRAVLVQTAGDLEI